MKAALWDEACKINMEISWWSGRTTFSHVVYRDILSSWKVSSAWARNISYLLNRHRTVTASQHSGPIAVPENSRQDQFGNWWGRAPRSTVFLDVSQLAVNPNWLICEFIHSKTPQGPNTIQQVPVPREGNTAKTLSKCQTVSSKCVRTLKWL